MRVIGATLDDSVGESFDKVSKMLGYAYPGGPVIEKLALKGDAFRFSFPLPLKQHKALAFSYSGLKNSVRLEIEKLGESRTKQDDADIAASFQKAAFYHIIHQLGRYFKKQSGHKFALVGGVSANLYFRAELELLCAKYGRELLCAPLEYCSDNAAMIARASLEAYHQNLTTTVAQCDVMSRLSL
jgi:N6-L-threonylcarbamoyladenine synthase